MKLQEIHERKEVKRSDGRIEIHNPSIMDIEPGHMVRVRGDRPPAHKNFRPDSQRVWGQMATDVDHKRGLVKVKEYMGGSKEFEEWVSIDDITTTWDVGGVERAEQLSSELGQALRDVDKASRGEIEGRPKKQGNFLFQKGNTVRVMKPVERGGRNWKGQQGVVLSTRYVEGDSEPQVLVQIGDRTISFNQTDLADSPQGKIH